VARPYLVDDEGSSVMRMFKSYQSSTRFVREIATLKYKEGMQGAWKYHCGQVLYHKCDLIAYLLPKCGTTEVWGDPNACQLEENL